MRLWLVIAASILILLSCASSTSVEKSTFIYPDTPIATQPATQPELFIFTFPTTQPATLENLQKRIQFLEIRIMILELDQKFLKDYIKALIEILREKKYDVYKENDHKARV